jgi:hypothetical protein
VVGVLGYVSTRATGGLSMTSGAMSMKPWLALHVGGAVLVGLLGAFEVLRRHERSRYYIVRGMLAGVPLLAMGGAAAWLMRRQAQAGEREVQVPMPTSAAGIAPVPSDTTIMGLPAWVVWIGAFVVSVIALVLMCACVHCVIRAFEMGRARRSSAHGPA